MNTETYNLKLEELERDKERLDWLADRSQSIGNVELPFQCVQNNVDSLRGAIDEAMKMHNNKD